jgi:hypothetical protein
MFDVSVPDKLTLSGGFPHNFPGFRTIPRDMIIVTPDNIARFGLFFK